MDGFSEPHVILNLRKQNVALSFYAAFDSQGHVSDKKGPAVKFVAGRARRALVSQGHVFAKRGLQLSLLPGEPTEP